MDATSEPGWLTAARLFLQVLIPVILVLTSVRLLMTDTFVRFNYALPGFPADSYGFTQQDRLIHAPVALEFLLNEADINFLGDQRFEDGTPVYNARELRHMVDVKEVTQTTLNVRRILLIAAVAISILVWRVAGIQVLLQSLRAGARLTAVGMVVLLVALIIGFSVLFIAFHEVFFDPDTWTFLYSDPLIRLFPERFWQVAFATIGLGTLVQAGFLYVISRFLISRGT